MSYLKNTIGFVFPSPMTSDESLEDYHQSISNTYYMVSYDSDNKQKAPIYDILTLQKEGIVKFKIRVKVRNDLQDLALVANKEANTYHVIKHETYYSKLQLKYYYSQKTYFNYIKNFVEGVKVDDVGDQTITSLIATHQNRLRCFINALRNSQYTEPPSRTYPKQQLLQHDIRPELTV